MLEHHPQLGYLIERTGWLLIHSLWQFTLWALVAFVVLKCLRRASSAARYGSLVCILALMTLTPAVTWWFLPDAPQLIAQTEPQVIADILSSDPGIESIPLAEPDRFSHLMTRTESTASSNVTAPAAITAGTSHESSYHNEPSQVASWSTAIHQTLEPWLTWIVGVWFAGMLAFSLRPLVGWTTMRRLGRQGISDVPDNVLSLLQETAERLGIRKAVSIFQSSLVTVPLVTGFLRPMILLPASVVTGFPPAQLQAILAHELAHIRRYDQFVNLWQTLVETIFFYHPLVWWLSHQIRCERENCCDDLAVSATGGKAEYGRALVALDELRDTSAALALSSHGGSLSERIRRLVSGEPSRHRAGPLGIIAFLILLCGIAAVFLVWNPEVPSLANLKADSKPQAETAMSAEEQAAWDALDEMGCTINGEAFARLSQRRQVKTLESQFFPEDQLQKLRKDANQPIQSAGFFVAPSEAWPQIAKLQSLRELSFVGTDVRGKPMEIIGQLKNVRHIDMVNGECFPDDLAQLKNLPELESVEIMLSVFGKHKDEWIAQRGELTAEEKQRLAELVSQAPPDRQSRYRNVVLAAIDTDRAIRELSGLENLRSFKLINTSVTGASIQYLSQLPRLEEIELSVIGFTREDARALGQVSTLRSFLKVSVDDEILQQLGSLSQLEQLETWADGVTDKGVSHLLKLQNLKKLILRDNRLDDADLLQLAQLPKLEYLDIRYSKGPLSLAGVLAFQEKKPDCRLEVDNDLPLVPPEQTKPGAGKPEPKQNPEEEVKDIPVLERKVSLKIKGMPLRDALRNITRQANIELEVDALALWEDAKLNVFEEVDADFADLTLSQALSELIDWRAHLGAFREVRGGKLILTTISAHREHVRQRLPEWLKPLLDRGMLATLDDNDEVEKLYFNNVITDELLAKLKTLPRLRMLNIESTNQLSPAGLVHLRELENLRTLEVYNINENHGLGDEILKNITGLEQLRELSIGECGVTDAGLKLLEQMPQLTSLRLNNEGLLTSACLSSIAKLENLKLLSMNSYVSTAQYGWMKFRSDGLQQLSALRNLEELYLAGQSFPADSFTFTKLKSLDVSGEQVDDEFVKKLSQCPDLQTLHLWRTRVTDAGLKQIAELPELRKLSLFDIPITDEGLRALQNSRHLEHLELRNLKITDTGIGYLEKINTLTRLDLHACTQTTVAGLEPLKSLPHLQTLWLTNFPDQTGYRELSRLKHLRELTFMMCGITYEDWKWLKTEMPRTQINHMTGGGGFSTFEPPPAPNFKVELPRPPRELQREADEQPIIPLKQPEEDPVEEKEEVIPPRTRDPADVDAPLRLRVSRKNPPDWVIPSGGGWPLNTRIPAFLQDDTLLVVGDGGSQLQVLDPKDGTTIRSVSDVGYTFDSLRISHDRRRVACIKRPRVSVGSGRLNYSVQFEVRACPSLEPAGKPIVHDEIWGQSEFAISPNGDFIAFGGREGVFIWNVETGQQIKQVPIDVKRIDALAFSPDGRRLVISNQNDLMCWQWQSDKPPQTIHVGRKIDSLAFTPDSRYLFEGPDSRIDIEVRDLKTMEVARRLKDETGHPMYVNNMQLTDGGKTLVAGNDIGFDWRKVIVNDRIHFWDIETGKILRKFDFTRHTVDSIAVSPNGRYLVAIVQDLDGALLGGWDLTKLDADKPD